MKFPPILFFVLASLFFRCGSDSPATVPDTVSPAKDTVSAVHDRSDINNSCCFHSSKDFEPFAPQSCGNFHLLPNADIQLKCITDTMAHSTATFSYANEESHVVNVTISDYCAAPAVFTSDYALKFESFKGPERQGEFNEFDVPDSHHGFSNFDPKTRTAVLIVSVDNRFLVEITDQVCENTKNVLTVYEALPLKELSDYDK